MYSSYRRHIGVFCCQAEQLRAQNALSCRHSCGWRRGRNVTRSCLTASCSCSKRTPRTWCVRCRTKLKATLPDLVVMHTLPHSKRRKRSRMCWPQCSARIIQQANNSLERKWSGMNDVCIRTHTLTRPYSPMHICLCSQCPRTTIALPRVRLSEHSLITHTASPLAPWPSLSPTCMTQTSLAGFYKDRVVHKLTRCCGKTCGVFGPRCVHATNWRGSKRLTNHFALDFVHQGRATGYRVNGAAPQPSLALRVSEVCVIARYTSHMLPRSKPPVGFVNCTGRCFNDYSRHGKCVVRLALAVRCHPCCDDCALPSLITGHMRGRKGWLITYHLLQSTPDQATGLSRKHNWNGFECCRRLRVQDLTVTPLGASVDYVDGALNQAQVGVTPAGFG